MMTTGNCSLLQQQFPHDEIESALVLLFDDINEKLDDEYPRDEYYATLSTTATTNTTTNNNTSAVGTDNDTKVVSLSQQQQNQKQFLLPMNKTIIDNNEDDIGRYSTTATTTTTSLTNNKNNIKNKNKYKKMKMVHFNDESRYNRTYYIDKIPKEEIQYIWFTKNEINTIHNNATIEDFRFSSKNKRIQNFVRRILLLYNSFETMGYNNNNKSTTNNNKKINPNRKYHHCHRHRHQYNKSLYRLSRDCSIHVRHKAKRTAALLTSEVNGFLLQQDNYTNNEQQQEQQHHHHQQQQHYHHNHSSSSLNNNYNYSNNTNINTILDHLKGLSYYVTEKIPMNSSQSNQFFLCGGWNQKCWC